MVTQLLVPLHTSPEGDCNTEGLARHVEVLAKHLHADISAVVHVIDYPTVSHPIARSLINVPGLKAQAKAAARAQGQQVIDAIRQAIDGTELSTRSSEIECFAGSFGHVVAELARYTDIAVIGMGPAHLAQSTAEAVLFGSGRPIMLIPEATAPAVPDRVLIAWDGSRSAARAVADAQEILRRAQSVVVTTVTAEKPLPEGDIGQRLTSYLGLHGIKAEAVRVPREGRNTGDVLQEQAKRIGSTLLVMGGFGHSRVRDFVLGGATRNVIAEPKLPILLSH